MYEVNNAGKPGEREWNSLIAAGGTETTDSLERGQGGITEGEFGRDRCESRSLGHSESGTQHQSHDISGVRRLVTWFLIGL